MTGDGLSRCILHPRLVRHGLGVLAKGVLRPRPGRERVTGGAGTSALRVTTCAVGAETNGLPPLLYYFKRGLVAVPPAAATGLEYAFMMMLLPLLVARVFLLFSRGPYLRVVATARPSCEAHISSALLAPPSPRTRHYLRTPVVWIFRQRHGSRTCTNLQSGYMYRQADHQVTKGSTTRHDLASGCFLGVQRSGRGFGRPLRWPFAALDGRGGFASSMAKTGPGVSRRMW